MKDIRIPFRARFKWALLNGEKTWTTRSRAYGEPGDRFTVFEAVFELIAVAEVPLGIVAAYGFEKEGFETREDFIRAWEELHPLIGYDPDALKFVHVFKRLS